MATLITLPIQIATAHISHQNVLILQNENVIFVIFILLLFCTVRFVVIVQKKKSCFVLTVLTMMEVDVTFIKIAIINLIWKESCQSHMI